jgi:hypothetical protein
VALAFQKAGLFLTIVVPTMKTYRLENIDEPLFFLVDTSVQSFSASDGTVIR